MALTIYLSRLLGVVMLIVATAMLADKHMVVTALSELTVDRTPLLLLGFIRIVMGAAIVLTHNVWSRGFWPLLVTFTGWAMLVRGVMVLFVPPDVMGTFMIAAHVLDLYYLYAAIPLVLGGYLALRGFSVSAPPLGLSAYPAVPAAKSPLSAPKPRTARPHPHRPR